MEFKVFSYCDFINVLYLINLSVNAFAIDVIIALC